MCRFEVGSMLEVGVGTMLKESVEEERVVIFDAVMI